VLAVHTTWSQTKVLGVLPQRMSPNPAHFVLPVLLLVVALATPAMAAAPSVPNATAAATSCARGTSIDARLRPADLVYASRLLPCILRTERAQLGVGFRERRSLSQSVAQALKKFIAAKQLKHGATNPVVAVNRAMNFIAAVYCLRSRHTRYSLAFNVVDSRPPPVLTTLTLARVTAHLFSHAVMHNAKLAFGVAIRRGVMFNGNDRDGIATGWIAVGCS
jgi:hypothetical protein